jgi:hypothetical protein
MLYTCVIFYQKKFGFDATLINKNFRKILEGSLKLKKSFFY